MSAPDFAALLAGAQGLDAAAAPMTAGLSLGEYTALWFAGSIDFADCVRLVRLRGEAMQSASEACPSSMVSLMGADEAGTLDRLTGLRRDILEPLIAEHNGRVVKLMGDGFLVEFPSVVDAVACGLAWQAGVAGWDSAISFRIGINLGDVLVKDGDIFGEGVNIAARLEGLAEPDGLLFRFNRAFIFSQFSDTKPTNPWGRNTVTATNSPPKANSQASGMMPVNTVLP